ncbi:hypothetical protein LSAT2_023573 [Lamellibrachia satsuma]|nr:hypothetical protein LSAT2_023573 [Lamellibrachia satsuma]
MAVQAQYFVVDHQVGDQVDDAAISVVQLVALRHPKCIIRHIYVSHILWSEIWREICVRLSHTDSCSVETSSHCVCHCYSYFLLVSHVRFLVDAR